MVDKEKLRAWLQDAAVDAAVIVAGAALILGLWYLCFHI